MPDSRNVVSKHLLKMIVLATVTMLLAKVILSLLNVQLPWSTAVTIGVLVSVLCLDSRFTISDLVKSKDDDSAPKTLETVEATPNPRSEIRQIRLCFQITTCAMYAHLLVDAYQMYTRDSYDFVWLWLLLLFSYFYSVHLFNKLAKKYD